MRPRPRSGWTVAWTGTLLVLVLLALLPQAWWRALWPDAARRDAPAPAATLDVDFEVETSWSPPPPILVPIPAHDDREPPPPERHDPAWWDLAWQVRAARDLVAAPDTLRSWPDLGRLGLPMTVEAALAVTDSALEARIWELVWEDRLDLSELRDYFHAIGRGRAYVDLRSREAAMFGEFMFETIVVPDPDDD